MTDSTYNTDDWLLGKSEDEAGVEWTRGMARDSIPLDYNDDGTIAGRIYDQEGGWQPLRLANTIENEMFVRWLRVHDRYTPRGRDLAPERAPEGKVPNDGNVTGYPSAPITGE